jgi:uncharacterized protein YcbK (DUF882 family)
VHPAVDLEEFIDGLGLRHFRGSELTPYWHRIRERNGVDVRNNIPPEALWHNIVPTLIVLDEIREQLGTPVELLSTYRSPAYNKAVGGEPNSFHMRFQAIDFTSEHHGGIRYIHQLAKSMRGKLFRLPGNEGNFRYQGGIGLYVTSNFVHIDCRGYEANWTG